MYFVADFFWVLIRCQAPWLLQVLTFNLLNNYRKQMIIVILYVYGNCGTEQFDTLNHFQNTILSLQQLPNTLCKKPISLTRISLNHILAKLYTVLSLLTSLEYCNLVLLPFSVLLVSQRYSVFLLGTQYSFNPCLVLLTSLGLVKTWLFYRFFFFLFYSF